MSEQITTIQSHISQQQKSLHPTASGRFTAMLWDLVLACKQITHEVRRAGLADILGSVGTTNVSGDVVQKLDIFAHERIIRAMERGGHLCVMASEERTELIPIPRQYRRGKYVLMFDPLDGSSNIDVNMSIGTIFSIHKKVTRGRDGGIEDCLQAGTEQVAAGYVIYGSSTMLVYTTGDGVHGFTLDPSIGEFLLTHEDLRIPSRGMIYSINEGNAGGWNEGTREYLRYLKDPEQGESHPYSLRYVGTLVSDFHRTLIKGGIFMYPETPKPKLRLLYEAAPMAMIAEQAGGAATDGSRRILDIIPKELHQQVGLIIGSAADVEDYHRFQKKAAEKGLSRKQAAK